MAKLIFVVEDDELLREATQELLVTEGYEVNTFINGKEAFDALKTAKTLPGIIILDLMMPVMDGYKFLDAISKEERLNKIIVLVTSADIEADTRLHSDQVKALIPKPFNIGLLLEVIKHFSSK